MTTMMKTRSTHSDPGNRDSSGGASAETSDDNDIRRLEPQKSSPSFVDVTASPFFQKLNFKSPVNTKNSTNLGVTSPKGNEIVTTHKWLPQHEEILKTWKSKCFVNMWLQNKSCYYYALLHNVLSYPIIILSACSSAALFSIDQCKEESAYIKYFMAVLSLVSGLLIAIIRQLKPDELSLCFSTTMKKYQLIIRKIDTILDLSPKMRIESPEIVIERLCVEIEAISQNQLYPPSLVIQQFQRKFGNVHEILYGQDIIELLRKDLENRRVIKKEIKRAMNFSLSNIMKTKQPDLPSRSSLNI